MSSQRPSLSMTFEAQTLGEQGVEQPSAAADISIDVVVALAKGTLTQREALGVGEESIQELTRYGYRLLEQQYFPQAAVIFDALVTLDPNVAYFHLALASAMRNLGQKNRAMEEYEEAKKLDPKDITPHINQAQILIRDGRRFEARSLLEAARALDPKGRHPLAGEARILWMTHIEPYGEPAKAGRRADSAQNQRKPAKVPRHAV